MKLFRLSITCVVFFLATVSNSFADSGTTRSRKSAPNLTPGGCNLNDLTPSIVKKVFEGPSAGFPVSNLEDGDVYEAVMSYGDSALVYTSIAMPTNSRTEFIMVSNLNLNLLEELHDEDQAYDSEQEHYPFGADLGALYDHPSVDLSEISGDFGVLTFSAYRCEEKQWRLKVISGRQHVDESLEENYTVEITPTEEVDPSLSTGMLNGYLSKSEVGSFILRFPEHQDLAASEASFRARYGFSKCMTEGYEYLEFDGVAETTYYQDELEVIRDSYFDRNPDNREYACNGTLVPTTLEGHESDFYVSHHTTIYARRKLARKSSANFSALISSYEELDIAETGKYGSGEPYSRKFRDEKEGLDLRRDGVLGQRVSRTRRRLLTTTNEIGSDRRGRWIHSYSIDPNDASNSKSISFDATVSLYSVSGTNSNGYLITEQSGTLTRSSVFHPTSGTVSEFSGNYSKSAPFLANYSLQMSFPVDIHSSEADSFVIGSIEYPGSQSSGPHHFSSCADALSHASGQYRPLTEMMEMESSVFGVATGYPYCTDSPLPAPNPEEDIEWPDLEEE